MHSRVDRILMELGDVALQIYALEAFSFHEAVRLHDAIVALVRCQSILANLDCTYGTLSKTDSGES